jgi:hypothetical protein
MGGMLVGMHAKEVCDRLNNYSRLQAQLEAVKTILALTEELNMSNYDHELVQQLNDGFIELCGLFDWQEAAIGESDE